MRLGTGDVVWHEAPFKKPTPSGGRPSRPWLIVSNDNHPFQGSECIVLGMTTNPRAEGIRVQQSDWRDSGTTKISFVSPWFAMTLKYSDITHRLGKVKESIVNDAIDDLWSRLGP